jgi:hypothetical protein
MFVGNYRVVKHSKDPKIIEQHQAKAELLGRGRKGSDKITLVLYLEPVGDYFDLRDGSGKIKNAAPPATLPPVERPLPPAHK